MAKSYPSLGHLSTLVNETSQNLPNLLFVKNLTCLALLDVGGNPNDDAYQLRA